MNRIRGIPLAVLEATDQPTTEPGDADMHLVLRFHHDARGSGWSRVDAATAWHEANFDYHDLVSVSPVTCSPGAGELTGTAPVALARHGTAALNPVVGPRGVVSR
ncbi:hypothetical protein [Amycolatopsis sp. NPDC051903]|uniref:hypothetical protein n=1 Tax=Amycolatopsis sp. NPDC051903 TaxID=3363936 RepID=UPI00378F9639